MYMGEKRNGNLKKIIPFLGLVPLILGAIGYYLEGNKILDSLYGSLALYGISPVLDSHGSCLIEIARWTAPLVLATALLCVLKQFRDRIWWWLEASSSKCIAIYSDEDHVLHFEDGDRRENYFVIYPERTLVKRARKQVIMLNSDQESLDFYTKNSDRLKKRDVYIGLKELDCGLMKEQENPNLIFYDVNGAVARILWKQIKIWKKNKNKSKPITICILGDGHLGQAILNTGLLLNLYSLEQNIFYYLVGDAKLYQSAHGMVKTCNRDRVIYRSSEDQDVLDIIIKSDYIIVSEVLMLDQLQTIGVLGRDSKVFYYAPGDGGADTYLNLSCLIPFGSDREIFTYQNICKEGLLQKAMQLNEQYACEYNKDHGTKEEEWRNLNGFLKWSNISAADYNEVLSDIVKENNYKQNENLEELAELEHIRWCRFHYLNYWSYGKVRDNEKRLHPCLCGYQELDEVNKEKDRSVVRQACGWKV